MEVKRSTKAKAAVATTVFPWDLDGAVCPSPLPYPSEAQGSWQKPGPKDFL